MLDTLADTDRAYVVAAMRDVGDVQQWRGVGRRAEELQPGVKNGWSIERDDGRDHWITATVGFVGPDEGTIVAAIVTTSRLDGDSLDRGVQVLHRPRRPRSSAPGYLRPSSSSPPTRRIATWRGACR